MSRRGLHPAATAAVFKREHGATLVEMTLILPLLLTVVFGLLECSRLAYTYTTLADAARAGTRYAIVHGSDRTGSGIDGPSGPGNTANVITVATNLAVAAGLSAGNLSVNVSYPNGNGVGAPVTVSVTYPFQAVPSPLIPLNLTLGSTSQGTICY